MWCVISFFVLFPPRAVFRSRLVQGDKHLIHPILEWLLKNMGALKMRAYLAQYLVKVEVPVAISSDTDVSASYDQVGLFAYV